MTTDARSQSSDHPLADRVAALGSPPLFVGRERELRQLELAFDSAAGRQGALIMLVGEPGIGKTAPCDQLARFVKAHGGVALVGHCYEEGSFRIPYQPFVDAFDSYLQECELDELTADLGPGAACADRSNAGRAAPRHTPTAGRPRGGSLAVAACRGALLHGAATHQPLLLVLEDLHDADRGTLDLLVYLARYLQGASIEVVGTYRDVEVDRAHPLSAALSQLLPRQ